MSASVTRIHGERPEALWHLGQVKLTRAGEIDIEQAEAFLLSLDQEMTGADLPRAAYLLGLAEAHLANCVELLRAVTR
jgi:hypothetical protein